MANIDTYTDELVASAQQFVFDFFKNNYTADIFFHNYSYTVEIISEAKKIVKAEGMSSADSQQIFLACWFLNTGYIKKGENPLQDSVTIATEFLEQHNIPNSQINTVTHAILVSETIEKLQSIIDKAVYDLANVYITFSDYRDRLALLEEENKRIFEIPEETDNTENTINFLENKHRFQTEYAVTNWEIQKQKNLLKLLKKRNKKSDNKLEAKLKKQLAKETDKGVNNLYRITLRNHISLSENADRKAHILLSVNSIIVSLVLSRLFPKLDSPSNQYLYIPTVIFLTFAVIGIILSIVATRPRVTAGKFSKEDVSERKTNILFFGNFHEMKFEDFEWGMNEVMKDKNMIYHSLTKDLYYLGKVVAKKYQVLRVSYTVFVIGIVISVIAFAIAYNMNY
ncbi:Pycsar system effector family protein [Zunongwangia sp.]|uniref:Pycsar system effector family protein n=1 Tax=Zunongwangia sp. TaxID=1965325 RepID=UPI003AA7FD32